MDLKSLHDMLTQLALLFAPQTVSKHTAHRVCAETVAAEHCMQPGCIRFLQIRILTLGSFSGSEVNDNKIPCTLQIRGYI